MAATNLFMNFTGVTFTYGGTPTTITIDEVKSVKVDRKSQPVEWYADADVFPKLIVTKNRTRTVTLMGGDVAKLNSVPDGTSGTLVFILNDAKNGTGSGAITFTLINAIMTDNPSDGENNKFATGSISFTAFSTDGVTDPLTSAIAP